MPEIRQYQQQVEPSGPVGVQRANSDAFGGQVGSAVEGLGRSADRLNGAIEQRKSQDDIMGLHSRMAQTEVDIQKQYEDQLQKGTLNHDEFMGYVQDSLEKVGQGVNTRAGQIRFSDLSANAKLSFAQKSIAGQAELAGDKAVADVKTSLDSMGDMVMHDPGSFQNKLAQSQKLVDDMVATAGLKATQAPMIKKMAMDKMAEAAIRGMITGPGIVDANGKKISGPEQARQELASGKWSQFMGEGTEYKLDRAINAGMNAQQAKETRFKKLQEDAKAEEQEKVSQVFTNKLYSNGLSTDDVLKAMNAGQIDSATAQHWNAMIEKRQSDKMTNDPVTVRNLFADIHKSESDPTKQIKQQSDLDKYFIQGRINEEGLKYLRGEFIGKGTEEGTNESVLKGNLVKAATAAIAKPGPMGIVDPTAQTNMNSWMFDMMKRVQDAKQSGTFSLDMFNPKSDKYLGSNFNDYQRTPQDIMKDMADRMKRQAPKGYTTMLDPEGKELHIPDGNVEKAKARGLKVKGK